jgi:flavin-dependent dehydrogenase
MLADRASELGVRQILTGPGLAIDLSQSVCRAIPSPQSPEIAASFVIDATGRAAWFARRCGICLLPEDRQIAVVTVLAASRGSVEDTASLVEAVEDGWWYSAPVPGDRVVTAFFTDADRLEQYGKIGSEAWMGLLNQTEHTRARVRDHRLQVASIPSVVSAGSQRLQRFAGKRWLAIGDAAMTLDPLSAHGLTLAAKSAYDAIEAIRALRAGRTEALVRYDSALKEVWCQYARRRAEYYDLERRWPDAPYWRRRRHAASTLSN